MVHPAKQKNVLVVVSLDYFQKLNQTFPDNVLYVTSNKVVAKQNEEGVLIPKFDLVTITGNING